MFEGLTGLPPPMHISCPEHLTRSVRRASGFVPTAIWRPEVPVGPLYPSRLPRTFPPRSYFLASGLRAVMAGLPSHSFSFDQRRRPDTLRTAMATAFFWPTRTTSRLPRVTPV